MIHYCNRETTLQLQSRVDGKSSGRLFPSTSAEILPGRCELPHPYIEDPPCLSRRYKFQTTLEIDPTAQTAYLSTLSQREFASRSLGESVSAPILLGGALIPSTF
jgi:hypothetical protein